jgi:L,D-transpeptidase ErfK/SrfK
MRLFHFPAEARGTEVVTYPVGIGKEGRSTPMGAMWIARKKEHPTWYPTQNIRNHHRQKGDLLPAAVLPGPDNPLGEYAMYLSRQPYLIHGTNKPYSIGWRASNGCIRLYPENIEQLFPTVSAKEPVTIVNQPYLVGWHQGRVYLQAHRPHTELDGRVLQQRLRAELKRVATESAQPLDWAAIDRTLAEARGVPMPVSGKTLSTEQVLAQAQPVDRPSRFLGQPETPSGATDGWHVMAAESVSESTARRLAAFLNHQGPQIPARTVLRGKHYQVVAGPYADARSAAAAVKRLQADLDMEGRVVAPNERLADGTVR